MGKSSKKEKIARQESSREQSSSREGSSRSNSVSRRALSSAPRSDHARNSSNQRTGGRHDGASSPPPSSSRVNSPQGVTSPRSAGTSLSGLHIPDRVNFDLAGSIYTSGALSLPARPPPTKLGQVAKVALNTYKVISYSTKDVHQYEVLIGNGVEKRGVVRGVWDSKAMKKAMGSDVIFDGNTLAWGLKPITEQIRLLVDLDKERGRPPKPGKEDVHRVVVKETTKIRFDVLERWLSGKCTFDKRCLEAMTCLDHILRETPSNKLLSMKRSFFDPNGERFDLGGGLEAMKGAYQSIRAVFGPTGPSLSINVDVANNTFWRSGSLINVCLAITKCRDVGQFVQGLKQQGPKGRLAKDIKRLQKKRVVANHRKGQPDTYSIDKFDFRGARGATFEREDPSTKKKTTVTVYDYFRKEYGRSLQYPDLPLVKTAKGALVPMELLALAPNQVSKFKLDDQQTTKMIGFAATPPAQRLASIQNALKMLDWPNDKVMQTYGLKVDTAQTKVDGRLLPAPKVVFGANGVANPGTSGRWDLKGKKFLTSNSAPLKVWGVGVIIGSRGGKPDKSVIENFINAFVGAYVNHGGRVETRKPIMILCEGPDPGAWVEQVWNKTGQSFNMRPQMLMFILPDKNSVVYQRIKRSADCRFGVVSQCVQYMHAQKAAPQYLSNVCMKFNAKLGGTTCRAVGPKSGGATGLFTTPTVIVGADVSHAAPGSQAISIAAITCSTDKLGVRYSAAVESNGHRVEMITERNFEKHLKPMLQFWSTEVNSGKLPKRLIYIRDGVSEGQFAQVLQQEVKYIKEILKGGDCELVVIIAQKRHQIRFFPQTGDRNGNALPGTLVEHGATTPFDNDFYLCAHAAIKGTARPTHYQVILNEAKMSNDDIYTLLYEHSYQYLRATTPVSIHPAVYYAHIASNRGVCHDQDFGSNPDDDSSDNKKSDIDAPTKDLLKMPTDGGIVNVPWFI